MKHISEELANRMPYAIFLVIIIGIILLIFIILVIKDLKRNFKEGFIAQCFFRITKRHRFKKGEKKFRLYDEYMDFYKCPTCRNLLYYEEKYVCPICGQVFKKY